MVLSSDSRVAEDIVSDVLGCTFEQWDRIRVMADPNAYVRRMVVNEYLTPRRGWRRTRPSPDARPPGDTIPDPSIAYAVNWLEQNAPEASGPAPDQVAPSPRSQSRSRRRRADHRTLYYVRLNEPAQTVEIVSVPVAGRPTTVLADGTRPTPSPDGHLSDQCRTPEVG
jgi:DNA-directed RNA polymerase specialized sigma24 family protein